MQFQPARVFGLILFVATPLFMLLGMINSFAPSNGLAKVVNFFSVLSLGSLAILIGLFVLNALGVQMNFGPRSVGNPPPGTRPQGTGSGFSA